MMKKLRKYLKRKKQLSLGNDGKWITEITINWKSKLLISFMFINIITIVGSLLCIIWSDWELGLRSLLTCLIFPYPVYKLIQKLFVNKIKIENVYEPIEDFDPVSEKTIE